MYLKESFREKNKKTGKRSEILSYPTQRSLTSLLAQALRTLRLCLEKHESESRREWMLWMMKRAGLKNSSNKEGQLWQHHNQPIELYNLDITKQKPGYIHMNPVVSGSVTKAEEYLYSSAIDYYGGKELLDIRLLDGY